MQAHILLLSLLAARGTSWPHFLFHDGCAKGLELLASGAPPNIMGAIPVFDMSILRIARAERQASEVVAGGRAELGAPLLLTHDGAKGPHGFQTVFVASSGVLDGGERCGDGSK